MRKCINLNQSWSFQKTADSEIIPIDIPHTWNAEDGQDGGNDYYRGCCVYRKHLSMSLIREAADAELNSGDRVYLEFCGANLCSIVKVNGIECGSHKGGYSTFRADITKVLQEENEIEVLVDNSPVRDVYPQKADFTFYGGIYRDVNLIVVPAVHFNLDYYGGTGFQVTPQVIGNGAKVKITAYASCEKALVRFTVDGIGSKETQVHEGKAETEFFLENVHLWNGLADPYLYHARAELFCVREVGESGDRDEDGGVGEGSGRDEDGGVGEGSGRDEVGSVEANDRDENSGRNKGNQALEDEVDTWFGCRSFSFDQEKGFFLNGRSYPLHGVSRHQDRKGIGNALTKEMHREDMEMILDMGANSVRLAHYQHDQYFYELCDKMGVIVWAEIPYISEHMPEASENALSQMTELVVQNYNHPSIICWALSNEITVTGVSSDLIKQHKKLNEWVHHLDSSRVTAMAHVFILETDSPVVDIPDIMSYNLYYGWYVGEMEENEVFLDGFHKKYPHKVIGLSEYGADACLQSQTSKPVKGDFSEQYQSIYHEHMLEMFSSRPYLWSTYVWNMFDFAADGREEAGEFGVNHKGLISFDRKVKKDAYYIYKAWWSSEPFVHLCGSRYVDRAEAVTEVKVYSNLSEVSLYKDGKLVELQKGSHVFVFHVSLESGHFIEAKSGGQQDSMTIRRAEQPNPSYQVVRGAVRNWFEEPGMEIVPGYFSIKDKVGEIRRSPEGKALLDAMTERILSSLGDVAKNVRGGANMEAMMNNMPMESMLRMGGRAISPEMIVALNKQLNQIPK